MNKTTYSFLHKIWSFFPPYFETFGVGLLLFLSLTATAKDFVLSPGQTVRVSMPRVERPVAETALGMLREDLKAVLDCRLTVAEHGSEAEIVVGLQPSLPREGFRWQVKDGRLHITASDEHGMAYGLLELSRQMGVSAWQYWADITPQRRSRFVLSDGYQTEQHPAVDYRGIFINDEDWGLNPWATRQEPEAWTIRHGRIKGAIGPKVTEQIFRLMLRLRANYYWPAMHECSQPFFTISGNREMAAKYGIYIGGSHCEPMATSPAAEWGIAGKGDYNYVSNREAVQDFWRRRLQEVRGQEIVYTLGMRGVHDGAMQGTKTREEKLYYLQQVIDDQRAMLDSMVGKVTTVPQVFVPYKEVLDIYRSGLRVPDDVTLMWTDDNYGYIRHFPDSVERRRSGGNGLYYHVSYWGRPHDYLWLNSFSPDLLTYQLTEAYRRDIRRMWILNVGDIKPSEYQIDLFMQLAWQGVEQSGMPATHLHDFVCSTFGKAYASRISSVMQEYFALSAEMKPEHLAGTRVEEADKAYWNQVRRMPGDWTKSSVRERVARYQRISDEAERLSRVIASNRRDAYFQLVKYPVQAAAQMNFKFLVPERSLAAYDSIQSLTREYNKVCAHGKWDGIMSAAPRNLPVFQRIDPKLLPDYPDSSPWQQLSGGRRNSDGSVTYTYRSAKGQDSLRLQVRLMPNHPFEGNSIAFCLEVDGVRLPECEYQTYDRSEEWKQNVLRGYAVRELTVPLNPHSRKHTIKVESPQPSPVVFSAEGMKKE